MCAFMFIVRVEASPAHYHSTAPMPVKQKTSPVSNKNNAHAVSPVHSDSHYEGALESQSCVSGVLRRFFAARKPLPHNYFSIMRIADQFNHSLSFQSNGYIFHRVRWKASNCERRCMHNCSGEKALCALRGPDMSKIREMADRLSNLQEGA